MLSLVVRPTVAPPWLNKDNLPPLRSSLLLFCLAISYTLSFTFSRSLLKIMYIESVMLSNHLIFHCPLLLLPLVRRVSSFPESGSFSTNWLFTLGGQSFGASVLASVLPMNIQGWFPLELTGLISLQSKGLSTVFSSTTIQKHQFFVIQPSSFFMVQLSHPYMTTGKTMGLPSWFRQ